MNMLRFFGLDAKVIVRKNSFVVYMKEGNNITDTLNLMGAVVSQMNLYNVMILKGISNDVNRKVNCETANLNKTIEAAVKQIKDIEWGKHCLIVSIDRNDTPITPKGDTVLKEGDIIVMTISQRRFQQDLNRIYSIINK